MGVYAFPSKKGRYFYPPAGRKAAREIKFLSPILVATIVRAGSNGKDVVEADFNSNNSIDTLPDLNENSFSWKQEIQVPTRRGSYEFRIYAYWIGEPEVEPGTPYNPDFHVLGTWKTVVE